MNFKRLQFSNAAGQRLSARLDLPVNTQPIAYALFAHCFTCSKNIKAASHISRALTHEGIAVFRFDFTGLGESEGDFGDTNFSSNVEDLVMAAEFMADKYEGPKILIGHSLGGAGRTPGVDPTPGDRRDSAGAHPAQRRALGQAERGRRSVVENLATARCQWRFTSAKSAGSCFLAAADSI